MDFLTFELQPLRLAILASATVEVARAVAVTVLPSAPAVVAGVINLRGDPTPVVDLRARFALPPTPVSAEHHLVIARCGPRRVAFHVDRVIDLISVADAVVHPATAVGPGAEHVAGFVTLPDGLIVIHDLEQLLSAGEAAALDTAMASGVTAASGVEAAVTVGKQQ